MPIEKLLKYEEMSDIGKGMYKAIYKSIYGKEIDTLFTRDGYPITDEMINSYNEEYEFKKLVIVQDSMNNRKSI